MKPLGNGAAMWHSGTLVSPEDKEITFLGRTALGRNIWSPIEQPSDGSVGEGGSSGNIFTEAPATSSFHAGSTIWSNSSQIAAVLLSYNSAHLGGTAISSDSNGGPLTAGVNGSTGDTTNLWQTSGPIYHGRNQSYPVRMLEGLARMILLC
jgi:hypothetical protein